VRDAGVAPADLVVDVGAGSGMLTRALVRAGARVIAIEPDRAFARRLRRACPEAEVREVDAFASGWPCEPFRVVANLPFAHAADLCRALLSDPRVAVRSADLLVEWDFALKRARLWPSTALGVVWGAWHELRVARRIEAAAFAPRPSVAAAVLQARRRPVPLVPVESAPGYAAFVRREFRRSSRARELDAHAWAERWQETSAAPRTVRRVTRPGRGR
jgi:23S rRNA (adenine-N6)-dimethyltransferase